MTAAALSIVTHIAPPRLLTDSSDRDFLYFRVPPILSVLEATQLRNQVHRSLAQRGEVNHSEVHHRSPETRHSPALIFDFGQTTFMDSSGVGALLHCYRMAQTQGMRLVLRQVLPQVRMVLQLTELDRVLTIEDSAIAALPPATEPHPVYTHPSVRSKLKRAIDILGACVGLALTLILGIPVAIAIKLEDGGPIFFRQTRCSWMGRPFQIWKFRSMVVDAERRKHEVANEIEGALFKNTNDHRITRLGKFLRKTSLDELPQFWNVLRGEMSLVGTRPPTLDEVERYEIPHWQRLDIKPGITGEWQVNGRSTITDFEEVVRLDLRYQENWSHWRDLQILFKTVAVIFSRHSGAH